MSAPTLTSEGETALHTISRGVGIPATSAIAEATAPRMVTEVVDYSFAVISAEAIREAGYAGSIRYLSPPPNEKNWTADQLEEHRAAGLHVGFVWETTTGRPRAGYAAGIADAQRANDLCDEFGAPADVAVYYACDERDLRIDEVDAYFRGVRDVGRRPRGVYGSKHILDNVIDRGYATHGWQVETWTDEWDGNRPVLSRHAAIVQLPNRTPRVDGTDANETSRDDWGQWKAPGSEATWEPRPIPEGNRISAVRSPNGRHVLVMQPDGNVVLYREGKPKWATATFGGDYVAQHQPDGNLVVYRPDGKPVWQSGTWRHPGSTLAVQDDGNVVIYAAANSGGRALWATNTEDRRGDPTPGLTPERAREWISIQNFRMGVAGFQEAWPGEDLAIDDDLGPRTVAAVEACIAQGGLLTANFHLDEFRCKHCGRCRVQRTLVRKLQAVRDHVGRPLGQWSSYRCEDHPIEASKATPGYHALGMAFDPNPYLPRGFVDPYGFGGVGISEVDDPGKVSHVDVREGYAEFPDN